jgi:hypothetical protein
MRNLLFTVSLLTAALAPYAAHANKIIGNG